MGEPKARTVTCMITGEPVPLDEAVPVDLVRKSLIPTLKKQVSHWDPHGYVGHRAIESARQEYVATLLEKDSGAIRRLHEEVAKSLRDQETISRLPTSDLDDHATFGQRLSDRIASFGGSWKFIGIFGFVLVLWMVVNASFVLGRNAFDPYPFIFLNLVLSCVAAIQAPVIMMSQNRQEERDRIRAENDYKVNLKAELEIRHLHEKLDRLLDDQWKHLLEIQQTQMDMMAELTAKR